MTHENSTPQIAKPGDSQNQVSARRRLIKGSFAAPAALTLCSGSALAAASQTCVQKLVTPPGGGNGGVDASPPLTTTDTSTTSFWRVQVYQSSSGPNNGSKWVRGLDIVSRQGVKPGATLTPFLSSNQYYRTNPAPNITSTNTTSSGSDATGTLNGTGQWIAVRVDSAGNIVGIQGIAASGSTSAMTATCWTSFKV